MSHTNESQGPPISAVTSQRRGTGTHHALAGAASRSYTAASAWEHTAALNEAQLRVVDQLGQYCSQRPYPTHVVEDQRYTAESSDSQAKDAFVGTLEDAVLHNTNQFHKWHSELEAACASETEEKYKRYADLLNSHLRSTEAILGKVDATMESFDLLQVQHRDVAAKSRQLHGSCEALVGEKDALVHFADALRAKLRFFDEFESVAAQFHAAQASTDSDHFLALLQKLDDCMQYVAANPQYADAGQYAVKFKTLQGRALNALRSKVAALLKNAVVQVQGGIQEAAAQSRPNGGAASASRKQQAPVLAEGADVSLLYVRFRAAAEPGLKGLFKDLESRSQRQEYTRLLSECHQLYCAARLQLIAPFVQQRVSEVGGLALTTATRNGCEHLMRVCQQEAVLFEAFFPATSPDSSQALAPLMEPLATMLYDALRPHIVQLHHLDELCELVDILKHEVLGEQAGRRGSGGDALKPILERTLADIQGRLIFRCQANADPTALLYPPLRATLTCLSKLYRAVDARIFGGMAQDAVSACTNSVQQASWQVARKSGPLDAQLFIIKHLLFLREQIVPFEVDFAVTDIDLDFTHMRDHMRRILAGESSVFTLSSSNAVVKMLGAGGPRVLQYQVDSKKEVEKQLKAVCEAFIMALTKVAVEPLLSFITKVTAVRVAANAAAAAAGLGQATRAAAAQPQSVLLSKPLREQAFASSAKLLEMVQRVNTSLTTTLPTAVAKMRLYLDSPSTHAILFKPVKANIAEAHGQIAALLSAEYGSGDEIHSAESNGNSSGQEGDGSSSQAATASDALALLKKPAELAVLLDSMC
ncbi:MAG: hypothetical protein WDW38_008507 [Sanguina aurantia]